jgi:DNA-binding CsgD family transcriptional regulator
MRARISEALMLDAIELIYQAGCDPAQWPELAAFCQRLFPGTAFSLHIELAAGCSDPLPEWAGWDPRFVELYRQHYHRINPYTEILRPIQPGHVVRASHLVTRRWLDRQPFYQEWLKPAGRFTHGAGCNLMSSANALTRLSYDIPEHLAEFEGAAADVLRRLAPHFQRALEVSSRLRGASVIRSGLQALLDRQEEPALVVDPRRRVVAANAAAVALLERRRVVRDVPRAGLVFVSKEADAAFGRALVACAAASEPAPFFAVEAEDGTRAPVYVLPLRGSVRAAAGTPVAALALVILKIAPRPRLPPPELLRTVYRLSTAEAAVALQIAHGRALETVAQDLGVSHATARNQLGAAMMKLGVHRQAELVALLAGLAP